MMVPGFYVVRMSYKGTGSRLIVESRPFVPGKKANWFWARQQAENWCDYIQKQYPKDDVFVMKRNF